MPLASFRPFAVAALLLAVALPAHGNETETDTAPAADAPPPITVVRGGGVAEVYREEGAGFAAYGPDEKQPPAVSESTESLVLRALKGATTIELVALSTTAGQTADGSCGSACVGGYAVAGRVPVEDEGGLAQVRAIAASWIGEPGAAPSDCAATYTHALKFTDGSFRYELLLAPDCRRYRILRGGLVGAEAELASAPSLDAIDARLRAR
ncbi:hypothetical protein [Arenimonas terrae]|uniref:Lipoprotein n=1 Tax=Arenimonas terrae TaxID=2546226 RepID=A0A5C4RXB8_9GAMM|nr:hypothetical protein [Arenimonas terrae]TNJ35569.1 hypothetical protein E1B00_07415 [Arenimonas terrae]